MTILVVDDNEEHLYLLQALLSGNGYQVVTAANGAEALAKARQNPPDLIVSDILMPVMDGFALCREWKKDERLRHIPFVFYTGTYTDEHDQKFGLGLGAEQFIVKPEEEEVFLRAIREVIQHVQRPSASPARVPIEAPRQDEEGYLKQYNEALIRKLEAKTEQLAQANRQLERNIAERKRAEEAVRASQQIIEGILNAIPVRVFWKDKNLVYLGCNEIFARDAGFASPKDIIGKDDYQMGWHDQAELYRGDDREVIESGCSKLLIEELQTTPEGKTITLLSNKLPLRDSNGEISGLLGTYMDITERKSAEAEHAALDQQLRQAQKMETVGQLAGGVAHDFNNILTGISGYTELALEQLDTASPMREDLAEVLRLSKRAAELTRQLLAFSRRQTLQPQIININDMVADTTKMLKRVLGENIDLQFAPAPDLGNVRADPMQLEQVLMNLAINARDAMPAGGKLTIETANVELDAEYAASHISVVPGRYVMMAVSDTGHGMDAATRSRLFEPFFTTKDKSKGTGLGLATAYGIVKQHGGHIWVYSEPGKGATFKIYLPRVEEAASVLKPPVEPSMTRGEETILIVEDEPAVGAIAERALKARGYTVLIARSAEEAEGLFSEHHERISLLLTDVVLPGINGPKLYERLRTRDPSLKVLYMSGHTGNATVHQGVLDAGAAFMQKPFTLEMIARKVRQVLDS
jgi:PAS domain S-box-containing protein